MSTNLISPALSYSVAFEGSGGGNVLSVPFAHCMPLDPSGKGVKTQPVKKEVGATMYATKVPLKVAITVPFKKILLPLRVLVSISSRTTYLDLSMALSLESGGGLNILTVPFE